VRRDTGVDLTPRAYPRSVSRWRSEIRHRTGASSRVRAAERARGDRSGRHCRGGPLPRVTVTIGFLAERQPLPLPTPVPGRSPGAGLGGPISPAPGPAAGRGDAIGGQYEQVVLLAVEEVENAWSLPRAANAWSHWSSTPKHPPRPLRACATAKALPTFSHCSTPTHQLGGGQCRSAEACAHASSPASRRKTSVKSFCTGAGAPGPAPRQPNARTAPALAAL
jgi:hypothetical protein